MAGVYATYPFTGGSSVGVTSLNGLSGAVDLVAGSGITITPSGNNLTIASTGGSGGFVVYGSLASPVLVTASGGLTSTSDQRALFIIQGSPGAVVVTANPQITAGTIIGQELRLVGNDNTATVQFNTGNGLYLNGLVTLAANQSIDLWWNGSVWVESSRSN